MSLVRCPSPLTRCFTFMHLLLTHSSVKNNKLPKSTEANTIPTMTLSSKLPTKLAEYALANIAQDLIVVGLTDGDYNIYNDSYDTLRSWACTSLDFVKHELLSLCYPIFAHCYINLIRTKNYQGIIGIIIHSIIRSLTHFRRWKILVFMGTWSPGEPLRSHSATVCVEGFKSIDRSSILEGESIRLQHCTLKIYHVDFIIWIKIVHFIFNSTWFTSHFLYC